MSSGTSRGGRSGGSGRSRDEADSADWFAKSATISGQVVLLGTLVVAPWFFAGAYGWFQQGCFLAILTALACAAVNVATRRHRVPVLPLTLLPLLLAIVLGLLQLVPWDAEVWRRVSPSSAALHDALLPETPLSSELPAVNAVELSAHLSPDAIWHPLSIYPAATRRELALLTMGVMAFVTGALFFGSTQTQRWLFLVVALNGAALALFGVVQKLAWNGEFYWCIRINEGNPFGPFINRNNSGGYLNICLAAALGLLLRAVDTGGHFRRDSHRSSSGDVPPDEPQPVGSVAAFRWVLVRLNGTSVGAGLLVVSVLAGVLCSLSRGAWISLAAAVVCVPATIQVFSGRKVRWSLFIACSAVAFLFLTWLGFEAAIHRRLESLLLPDSVSSDGRLLNWHEALHSAADNLVCGTGLGTYSYAYRPYQLGTHTGWHVHAENQYVEALVNGGIPGLVLLLAAIGLMAIAITWLLKAGTRHEHFVGAIVGAFTLSSQIVHAVFDFGLYMPANMLLMAVLCGAISGSAARLTMAHHESPKRWLMLPVLSGLVPAICAVLLVLGVLGWNETRRAAAIESQLYATAWQPGVHHVSQPQMVRAIDALSTAVRNRWDDAEGQLRLGWLWLWLYRMRAFDELHTALSPDTDDKMIERLSQPSQLHFRASEAARLDRSEELLRIRSLPVVINYLQPAWRHLVASRQACPLLPESHYQLGILAFVSGDPLADRLDFDRVRRLVPYDQGYQYEMAMLDLDSGRTEQAVAALRACWQSDPRRQDSIITTLHPTLSVSMLLERVVPDSPIALIQLAETRGTNDTDFVPYRESILAKAESLIQQQLPFHADGEAQYHYVLARLAQARNQPDEAIEHFKRATDLNPGGVEVRAEYAVFLAKIGRLELARAEAQACLALQPDVQEYQELVNRLDQALLNRAQQHMLKP